MVFSRGEIVIAAVEIKSTQRLDPGDLNGLRSIRTDYPHAKAFVIGPFTMRQLADGVEAAPWRDFLRTELMALG